MLLNLASVIQLALTAWFSIQLSLTGFSSRSISPSLRGIAESIDTMALQWAPSLSFPATDLVMKMDGILQQKNGGYFLSSMPFWTNSQPTSDMTTLPGTQVHTLPASQTWKEDAKATDTGRLARIYILVSVSSCIVIFGVSILIVHSSSANASDASPSVIDLLQIPRSLNGALSDDLPGRIDPTGFEWLSPEAAILDTPNGSRSDGTADKSTDPQLVSAAPTLDAEDSLPSPTLSTNDLYELSGCLGSRDTTDTVQQATGLCNVNISPEAITPVTDMDVGESSAAPEGQVPDTALTSPLPEVIYASRTTISDVETRTEFTGGLAVEDTPAREDTAATIGEVDSADLCAEDLLTETKEITGDGNEVGIEGVTSAYLDSDESSSSERSLDALLRHIPAEEDDDSYLNYDDIDVEELEESSRQTMGRADVDEQEDEQRDDAEELYEEDLVEGRDDSQDLEVFGESPLIEQMDGSPTHSNVDPRTELAHIALVPTQIQLLADDEINGALSESISIPSTSSSLSLGCLAGCNVGRSLLLQTFTEELCLAAQISDEFDEFDTPPFPTGRAMEHDGLLDEDRTTDVGTSTDLIEVEDEERLDINGGVQGSSGAVIEEDLEVFDDSLHGYEQAALEDGFEIERASEDSSISSCYEASEDGIIAPGESSTSGSVLPMDIFDSPPASPVFSFHSDDGFYCSLLTQTFSDELNLAGEISDDFSTGDIPPFPRSRPRSAQYSETQAEECLHHEDEAASIYSTEDIARSYPSSIPASPHASIAYSPIIHSPESLSPSLSFYLEEGYANGLGLLLMDQTFTEELDTIARLRDCVLGGDMSSAQETDKLAVHVTLENRYPNIAPYPSVYPWNLRMIYPSAPLTSKDRPTTQFQFNYPFIVIYEPVYPFVIPYPDKTPQVSSPIQPHMLEMNTSPFLLETEVGFALVKIKPDALVSEQSEDKSQAQSTVTSGLGTSVGISLPQADASSTIELSSSSSSPYTKDQQEILRTKKMDTFEGSSYYRLCFPSNEHILRKKFEEHRQEILGLKPMFTPEERTYRHPTVERFSKPLPVYMKKKSQALPPSPQIPQSSWCKPDSKEDLEFRERRIVDKTKETSTILGPSSLTRTPTSGSVSSVANKSLEDVISEHFATVHRNLMGSSGGNENSFPKDSDDILYPERFIVDDDSSIKIAPPCPPPSPVSSCGNLASMNGYIPSLPVVSVEETAAMVEIANNSIPAEYLNLTVLEDEEDEEDEEIPRGPPPSPASSVHGSYMTMNGLLPVNPVRSVEETARMVDVVYRELHSTSFQAPVSTTTEVRSTYSGDRSSLSLSAANDFVFCDLTMKHDDNDTLPSCSGFTSDSIVPEVLRDASNAQNQNTSQKRHSGLGNCRTGKENSATLAHESLQPLGAHDLRPASPPVRQGPRKNLRELLAEGRYTVSDETLKIAAEVNQLIAECTGKAKKRDAG